MSTYAPTPQEVALADWVESATGLSTIYAGQASARPSLPYATVRVLSERGIGSRADTETTDEAMGAGFKRKISKLYQGTASVQVYGAGAQAALRKLAMSLEEAEVRLALRNGGIVVSHVIADHSRTLQLLDTSFEGRAAADFAFRWVEKTEHETAVIETLNATQIGGAP